MNAVMRTSGVELLEQVANMLSASERMIALQYLYAASGAKATLHIHGSGTMAGVELSNGAGPTFSIPVPNWPLPQGQTLPPLAPVKPQGARKPPSFWMRLVEGHEPSKSGLPSLTGSWVKWQRGQPLDLNAAVGGTKLPVLVHYPDANGNWVHAVLGAAAPVLTWNPGLSWGPSEFTGCIAHVEGVARDVAIAECLRLLANAP